MSIGNKESRARMRVNDETRDAGLATPENVIRYDNITYGTLGEYPEWQTLDVYRPNTVREDVKLPVILSVHGGGWFYGDKEIYQWYCMDLARRGFAVVNFSYRLSPEYRFPAMHEDTNQVAAWIMNHADEYAFDTDNIFGVGDSAGGSILALYAAMTTNPDYAEHFDFTIPENFSFRAIALNCGALNGTEFNAPGHVSEQWIQVGKTIEMNLFGGEPDDDQRKLNSTYPWVSEKYPPTFILTATQDFLRWVQHGMVDVLEEHDVPFEYHLYGTKEHPLNHVFHCNIKLPDATKANDDECRFFRMHMSSVNHVENKQKG